jgi:eukaryotic-like serine/threonine-protein kinase
MVDGKILDSWKEIAEHLRRNVRTCQRWEREMGLPVHRLDGSSKARVFAYSGELDRWLAEKSHMLEVERDGRGGLGEPGPSGAAERSRSLILKKAILAAGSVLVGALIFVAVRTIPKGTSDRLPSSRRPSLAILEFDNTAGDRGLEGWRVGLSNLLIAGLSDSKFIHVVTDDRLYSVLKRLNLLETGRYSTEDLVRVARESGVDMTVSGAFIRADDKIIITLTVQKPRKGEIVRTSKVECNGEGDIIAKADELVRQIKLDLALTPEQIARDGDRELGRVTTPSAEAFKYYSEGRRLFLKPDYSKCLPPMEKAVEIDPEFALAYLSLGWVYGNRGDSDKRAYYLEKAYRWSERATEKERLLIQGEYFAQRESDFDKALEAFKKQIDLYPDAPAARLGRLYNRIEEWQKAIEYTGSPEQRGLGHPFVYYHLARAYMGLGDYERSRRVYRDYVNRFLERNPLVQDTIWLSYISEGNVEAASREARTEGKTPLLGAGDRELYSLILKGDWAEAEKLCWEASTWSFVRESLACVRLSQGRLNEAIEEMKKVAVLAKNTPAEEGASVFHAYLAQMYLRAGRAQEALEECRVAVARAAATGSISSWVYALDLTGAAWLEMNAPAEAQRCAEDLKIIAEKALNKKLIRHYYHLLGLIAFKKGDLKQAIGNLEKSVALLSGQLWDAGLAGNLHAYFMESLAAAYDRSGDFDKAREEYSKITDLGWGRFRHGDIFAESFFRLGRIAERKGEKAKARENYNRFLGLWRNADPGIPEVGEAKKRLAGL